MLKGQDHMTAHIRIRFWCDGCTADIKVSSNQVHDDAPLEWATVDLQWKRPNDRSPGQHATARRRLHLCPSCLSRVLDHVDFTDRKDKKHAATS